MTPYRTICTLLFILIAIGAMNIELLEVDSAQYAAISMECLQNGNFLHLYERGLDYLDKPHFIFWISSLFFSIFGLSTFAFKLPAIFTACVTARYVTKLEETLFDKSSRNSGFLFLASIGSVWIISDVKTDIYLTAFILMSIYHGVQLLSNRKWIDAILLGLFLGLGFTAKGWMGILFPVIILGFHCLTSKRLPPFLPLCLSLITLLITVAPMLYGLYTQFDLQMSDASNADHQQSGLHFHLWEQSFGRISGENYWRNDYSYLYLFHSFLLLIFPCSILLLASVIDFFKKRDWSPSTLLIWFSLLMPLCALSFSQYKIAHYAAIALPYSAIIIHQYLLQKDVFTRWLKIHHYFFFILAIIATLALAALWSDAVSLLIGLFVAALLFIFRKKIFSLSSASQIIILSGLLWGLAFTWPLGRWLNDYNLGFQMSQSILEKNIPVEQVRMYNEDSRSLEFNLKRRIPVWKGDHIVDWAADSTGLWFLMSLDGKNALQNAGVPFQDSLTIPYIDFNHIKLAHLTQTEQRAKNAFLMKI